MNQKRKTTAAQQPRLLDESRAIRTSLLSDALGKGGAMDHDMRCLSANCRMAGPAVTVRVHTADILMVGITLSQCPKGSVLVIDGQGELNTALWGEVTTLAARLKGLQGVVIDGAIRDLYRIHRDKFPVFARAVVPNAGGAQYAGEINVPVQCGGAIVHPGDWIVGDEDGVVVVPQERLEMVMDAARRLAIVEKKIRKEVGKGKDLATLLRYHELLDKKAKEGVLPQMRFQEK
ncbi:MAG: dimethylmenaquinone methyltransferase [Acidobacteria bacterium]|nr:MAG: dimethylmenaquinone methyltransferase [Acidobacteriota bacterium]